MTSNYLTLLPRTGMRLGRGKTGEGGVSKGRTGEVGGHERGGRSRAMAALNIYMSRVRAMPPVQLKHNIARSPGRRGIFFLVRIDRFLDIQL